MSGKFTVQEIRMKVTVLEILRRGNYIRLMDGRYDSGFVALDVLQAVIKDGDAETFDNHGVQLVRKVSKVTK